MLVLGWCWCWPSSRVRWRPFKLPGGLTGSRCFGMPLLVAWLPLFPRPLKHRAALLHFSSCMWTFVWVGVWARGEAGRHAGGS